MRYLGENLARFTLFVIVTVAELMLAVFLFVYGDMYLQWFAMFLLLVQLISLHLIYRYTAALFKVIFDKPQKYFPIV